MDNLNNRDCLRDVLNESRNTFNKFYSEADGLITGAVEYKTEIYKNINELMIQLQVIENLFNNRDWDDGVIDFFETNELSNLNKFFMKKYNSGDAEHIVKVKAGGDKEMLTDLKTKAITDTHAHVRERECGTDNMVDKSCRNIKKPCKSPCKKFHTTCYKVSDANYLYDSSPNKVGLGSTVNKPVSIRNKLILKVIESLKSLLQK